MTDIDKLKEKLTAQRLRNEIAGAFNMHLSQEEKDNFNNEMINKTWKYQKIYKFETKPQKGHEFWDVEADAFKHTFGSALLYFRYGDWGSTIAGIMHENKTKKNPRSEWNMDSWNNDQGRKIAKEILKEYGEDFYDKNPEKCENIIAAKIIVKMRNGELINHPDDKRKYKGLIEHLTKKNVIDDDKLKNGTPTGQAAPMSNSVSNKSSSVSKVKSESPKNFSDILRQKFKSIKSENNQKLSRIFKSNQNQKSGNGHWVTMNGAHVFIED